MSIQWVETEKYFEHALQKNRIDLPLFVFRITEEVTLQVGHRYFFTHIPHILTLYTFKTV